MKAQEEKLKEMKNELIISKPIKPSVYWLRIWLCSFTWLISVICPIVIIFFWWFNKSCNIESPIIVYKIMGFTMFLLCFVFSFAISDSKAPATPNFWNWLFGIKKYGNEIFEWNKKYYDYSKAKEAFETLTNLK